MSESNATPADETIPVDHAFSCENCGHRWYYTRSRCPNCAKNEVETYKLSHGELVVRTEVSMTPPDVRSPNALGLVRFGDLTLIAQLADDVAEVGSRVTFTGEHRLRDGDEFMGPRLTSV